MHGAWRLASAVARAPRRTPAQRRSDYHEGLVESTKLTKQNWVAASPPTAARLRSFRPSRSREPVASRGPAQLPRVRWPRAVARAPRRTPAQRRSDYHEGLVESTKLTKQNWVAASPPTTARLRAFRASRSRCDARTDTRCGSSRRDRGSTGPTTSLPLASDWSEKRTPGRSGTSRD